MIKIASQLLDGISNFASENPGLTAGILAGGGLGLLGGAMAPAESDDPNEDPNDRVNRRVRNALLAGGLGAAGAGLAGYGANMALQPIAEGGGLAFNEDLGWGIPTAGGIAAGTGAYTLDKARKHRLAANLMRNLAKETGNDAYKGLKGSEAFTALSEAMRGTGRADMEKSLAQLLVKADPNKPVTADQLKAVHKELERMGISTSDGSASRKLKRLVNNIGNDMANSGTVKDKLKALFGGISKPQNKLLAKSVGLDSAKRLGRFLGRNKWTIGAGLGGAALTDYLLNSN